ncbi:MAG: hypothetical protein B0A82_22205 [Alkalinema sp. CACIAM 70d]|nr:MAG: hypothetical protein B0A82_22205 [Alkalinema sp. CACIAM 70d]
MQMPAPVPRRFGHPLDRLALALIAALVLVIGVLLFVGDRGAPKVREFSWQDREVGAVDTAFVLNFSRPMDHDSVAQNLKITPALPGRISWAGRRMVYTLNFPAPYGEGFQVQLQEAQDRFQQGTYHAKMQPFSATFRTRDRVFAYLGTEGEEAGRIVLYNLTKEEKRLLTPSNLMVFDFKPYPLADRILFSAGDRATATSPSPNSPVPLVEQKLYTVTTGLRVNAPVASDSQSSDLPYSPGDAGQVLEVLDNQDYQNLKFDLSPDGRTIVVQRVSRKNQGQSEPWVLRSGQAPAPIKLEQPGGDFLITADSQSLILTQGEGLSVLPLQEGAEAPSFLPKFGNVLGLARDNTAAAMVKFNKNYTRSLFLVTSQGEKEILQTTGSILSAAFDPTKQLLYCLLTELLPGETYQEQPYLAAIDLKAAQTAANPNEALYPLLKLPNQREVKVSLAPDGVALLFDQPVTSNAQEGQTVQAGPLWLLPLASDPKQALEPQALPFTGIRPQWLP